MAAHAGYRVITEMRYEPARVERGYSGETLYVNVGTGAIERRPVTQEMKDKFIGGRGFGLWRLWNAVTEKTKWDDPENEIVIGAGPIGGITTYAGAGKSIVVSLSPTTGNVIDSNVGGYFGPYLKFSGWDALEIQGRADKDVIVFIDGDNGLVQILDCEEEDLNTHILSERLLHAFADSDSPKDLLAISTVSAGIGAEHTRIGCLNFSFFDMKRKLPRVKQAGRGGIGTVFRDKRIAALVVKYSDVRPDSNHPADPERVKRAGERITKEILELDSSSATCDMWGPHTWWRSWTNTTSSPHRTTVSAPIPRRRRSLPLSGGNGSVRTCPMDAGSVAPCPVRTRSITSPSRPAPTRVMPSPSTGRNMRRPPGAPTWGSTIPISCWR